MFQVEFVLISETAAGRDPVMTCRLMKNCLVKNKMKKATSQFQLLVDQLPHDSKMEGSSATATAWVGRE